MQNKILSAATALCLTTLAQASDVNISIQNGASNSVNVVVGSTVNYEIWAELSDTNSQGLALLCFDLNYTGGSLTQANGASSANQLNFATPLGQNNPAGFGGTPSGAGLLQVGGAQNTIKNSFAPTPNGVVITGVGAQGSPVLFASGSLQAPANPGTYQLTASNLLANAIRVGETGAGEFWAVDQAGAGSMLGLTIVVSDCTPVAYCTGKLNSSGCLPAIGSQGTSSMGGTDDFHITASNIVNDRSGIMFYGSASSMVPFLGGTLCVAAPHKRTSMQNSGNVNGTSCSGSFDFHFTQAQMAGAGLMTGSKFYAQYWYRDPLHQDSTGIGLTNAVEVTLCP